MLVIATTVNQLLGIVVITIHITLTIRYGTEKDAQTIDDTTQPWFYRDLNQTTQDYIEARICSSNPFNRASTLIDQLELYIQ